ncbi:enoyl-CoA hydratase/isomerase family protein [Aeromicrobium sp. SMF47]|uniref:enoyl-CoA hydratase/isomerase family protein n=1 Tax=Aeromicrobium TaxID=2040 RepID=UPI00129E731C|nr:MULTISPECIES: enoyl-CoA hydratase/isomerase family protein [Aeromicrobium]MRJ77341.1 enoyl-CoA hydratase/isomerase family protein [Aeromicrobium yanjiei]MRK01709.1 enoyl-CoA hydratase/isomerase family protein [Aeromicrobium sp. S22]
MTTVTSSQPAPGVTQVTLNRPEALNTLNDRLVTDLVRVLDEVAEDPDCRVVILTGQGRAFCAGLDLHGFGDEAKVEAQGEIVRQLTRQKEIAGLAQRLHSLPQPVIAAVNGPAAGGGLALVCASDVRIAAEPAVFAVSFIRAGFSACDIGVSWLLPRIVGAGRAHELMLTGRRFDAAEALRIGLLTDVVDADRLLQTALDKATQIMLNPPLSVELTKEGMWAALEISAFDTAVEFENRQQAFTSFTADRLEATAAFLEKRAPVYRRR